MQKLTMRNSLSGLHASFDPDSGDQAVVALRFEVEQNNLELPIHQHRKGQLVISRHGAVTCEVPNALWLVPPQHAVWIPGGTPHSNRSTHNARISYLFVEPDAAPMPQECCTLEISPLIRELVEYVADQAPSYPSDGPIARLVGVLLEQLVTAPKAQFHLPVSDHPKIRRMADALTSDPANRTTLAQWAHALAMSERTLARLVKQETGVTFGRWRQQLHIIVALRELSSGVSVQRVAGDLGYETVTAFSIMFKKALGKSPTQYFEALR